MPMVSVFGQHCLPLLLQADGRLFLSFPPS
jgi:hypothetical protein